MINYIFYWCVDFLANLAKLTGTTYELINILIFIIGYPVEEIEDFENTIISFKEHFKDRIYFEINYQNIEIKVFFDKKKLYLSGWETIDAYNNSVFTDIIIYEVNKIVNNNLFNLKEFY